MHGVVLTNPAFETVSGDLIPVEHWRLIFEEKIKLKQFMHDVNKPIRCEIFYMSLLAIFILRKKYFL